MIKQNDSMPKVSIIIPVYNKEHSISKCIQSLLNQTVDDIECIFVDDCSKDRSVEVIKSFTDERVKLICSSVNQGPMCARARGYKVAKGGYIMFCDADDTMPLDAVQKLYERVTETNSDIVIGNYCRVEIDGSTHIVKNQFPFGKDKIGVFKALLSWKQSQSLCDKIFKKELFTDNLVVVDGQKNGEDGWLLYQLIDNAKSLDILDDVIYNYVMDEVSTTHQRYSNDTLERIVRAIWGRVRIAFKYNDCKSLVYRHLFVLKYRLIEEGYNKQIISNAFRKYSTNSTSINAKVMFKYFSVYEIIKIFLVSTARRYYGKK